MSPKETAAELVAAIEKARQWLFDLDEATVRNMPSVDRWSIAQVVGHMIDSACNNHQRFVRAQFTDELTFPDYKQNQWVAGGNYHESDWNQLVELWFLYNLHLAHVMRNIPDDQLETLCTITPHETCSLGFLVSDYLVHMNHHLAKIRERVG